MADESARLPRRVLLDTNIFIVGYGPRTSAEESILSFLSAHRAETTLLLSNEILNQVSRVAKRVKGKDWAGLLLSYFWRDFNVDVVNLEDAGDLLGQYKDRIPSKDLLVFLTGLVGQADCFITRNHALLKAALGQHPPFECLTPEEFLAKYVAPKPNQN